MNRREFFHTSAGVLAALTAPGVWAVDAPQGQKWKYSFRPFRANDPAAPVTVVTPPDENFVFTYFNVCPWRPSGCYLFAMRLDGHPVWSRDYRQCCLQVAPEGNRQLIIADLSKVIT